MDQDTGKRLREVRTTLGLSQRKLAKASGVANATISQIESGNLNPTVSMLKKVLDGIPMSLSDFFSDAFEFSEQVFFRAEELVEIGKDDVSYQQVGRHLTDKAIQMLSECYQPGASTGKHPITHDGEECGIVLSGQLEVTVGDQSRVLHKGDAYYFKSTQPHHFKNTGREPCTVISACSPPGF